MICEVLETHRISSRWSTLEYAEVPLRSYPKVMAHARVSWMIPDDTYCIADASKNRFLQLLLESRILFRCFTNTMFHTFSNSIKACLISVPQFLRSWQIQNQHHWCIPNMDLDNLLSFAARIGTYAIVSGVRTTSINLMRKVPSPSSQRWPTSLLT